MEKKETPRSIFFITFHGLEAAALRNAAMGLEACLDGHILLSDEFEQKSKLLLALSELLIIPN